MRSEVFSVDAALLVSVAVLLIGVKLVLIHSFGWDLPFTDQWDAEAANLYIPFRAGGLRAVNWFAAHNEHRLATTRLLVLLVFIVNGQWDGLVEAVANIPVHIAGALILMRVVQQSGLPSLVRRLMILLVVAGIAAPFGWANTVSGFQSCFYFCITATLALLYLASRRSQTPLAYLCIVGFAAVAFASLAAGALSALAGALCLVFRQLATEKSDRRFVRWFVVGLLLVMAGLEVAITPATPSTVALPQSAHGFVYGMHHLLSFPTTAGALLVWSPLAALSWQLAKKTRSGDDPFIVFVFGLTVFVLSVAAAIATQRGGDLASRYTDILWFSYFINLGALALLAGDARRVDNPRWQWATVAYALCAITLFLDNGFGSLTQAREQREDLEAGSSHIRHYLETHDYVALSNAPATQIPYPSAGILGSWLSNESIRDILPPSVRAGTRNDRQTADQSFVVQGSGEIGRLRHAVDVLLAHAWGVLAFGLAAFLVTFTLLSPQNPGFRQPDTFP